MNPLDFLIAFGTGIAGGVAVRIWTGNREKEQGGRIVWLWVRQWMRRHPGLTCQQALQHLDRNFEDWNE